jgi:4-hydroxy-2-oxoheptanedioate aldolase
MSTKKTLKERIQAGEVLVSLRASIDIERRQLESTLARGKYDFLYVDGQHTAFSDDQLVSFCAMAEEISLPVQLRIPHTRQAYLIGRFLDLGLMAIMVPLVEKESQVDMAISQSYYPQIGARSWGGVARRGLKDWGRAVDRLEYADWWNRRSVLAIQFETVDAISNAGKLAKAGVDYVAFGPNDLLFDLEGHPGYPLRTVDACMRNVNEQLRGSGIRLGMAVPTRPGQREKFLEMGITIFQEDPS